MYRGECSCKNHCTKVINIMVLGQTGAGKTTLIDSLTNYILGIDLLDKIRVKLVDERDLVAERVGVNDGSSQQDKAKQA